MGKLNWGIGKIGNLNDALYTGAVKDVSTLISNTAENVSGIILPSAKAIIENTFQAIRSPYQTLKSGKNWLKGLRTLPVIGSDIVMKALRLPFATLDDAVQYIVNNNLERVTDYIKKNTTELVGNIISDNGNSRFKLLQKAGTGVTGIGDTIGTIIKAPTGGFGKLTQMTDEFLAGGTSTTNRWVNNLEISPDNFIPRRHYDGITNTYSMPEAANDTVNSLDVRRAA